MGTSSSPRGFSRLMGWEGTSLPNREREEWNQHKLGWVQDRARKTGWDNETLDARLPLYHRGCLLSEQEVSGVNRTWLL